MDAKQRAAEAALDLLADDLIVGLGTGSTADVFLVALSKALASGRVRNIRGVPTSKRSEQRAIELGIPLTSLAQCHQPDITIDGADEIAPNLDLIKGLGGALLREKIVAQNSKRLVIIADESKLVPTLGIKSALPVEVAIFGHETQELFLRDLGSQPALRRNSDSSPFLTDNGNYIYDCHFGRIDHPESLQQRLLLRAGVVDSGLFVNIADLALVAGKENVRRVTRPYRDGP